MMSRYRIAAMGLVSWDEILYTDDYPSAGRYTVVHQRLAQSGGTTGNIATALARLGMEISFAGMVGDDAEGRQLRDELAAEGIEVSHVRTREGEPTDRSFIIVSGCGAEVERTIFWQPGARLRHGDYLPIEDYFAHDLVVVDMDDAKLRRLIVDLPMHVSPRTLLLGPLTYLTELPPDDALDLALRHDFIVGNVEELCAITGTDELDAAIEILRDEMFLSQTRLVAISDGPRGCHVIDRRSVTHVPAFPVEAVDPTGAGDAFAAGVAIGVLERWSPQEIGRVANAVGALATRWRGARASLPRRDELEQFLASTGGLER